MFYSELRLDQYTALSAGHPAAESKWDKMSQFMVQQALPQHRDYTTGNLFTSNSYNSHYTVLYWQTNMGTSLPFHFFFSENHTSFVMHWRSLSETIFCNLTFFSDSVANEANDSEIQNLTHDQEVASSILAHDNSVGEEALLYPLLTMDSLLIVAP